MAETTEGEREREKKTHTCTKKSIPGINHRWRKKCKQRTISVKEKRKVEIKAEWQYKEASSIREEIVWEEKCTDDNLSTDWWGEKVYKGQKNSLVPVLYIYKKKKLLQEEITHEGRDGKEGQS